ncbi:MAG TPA: hypothetical protein VKG66_03510, partial [Steroidobacteraceae bacterium]|nr:hypothetical protein [Steroidobacteraceae bacterium]
QAALERVRDAAGPREAGRSLWAAASVSGNPTRLRTFEDTPRDSTTWGLLLRTGRLNRGDAETNDSLTGVPEKIREGDLTWRRSFGFNDIEAGVGLLHTDQPSLATSAYKPRAFLSWKRII